jgi:hypothetical protein
MKELAIIISKDATGKIIMVDSFKVLPAMQVVVSLIALTFLSVCGKRCFV